MGEGFGIRGGSIAPPHDPTATGRLGPLGVLPGGFSRGGKAVCAAEHRNSAGMEDKGWGLGVGAISS